MASYEPLKGLSSKLLPKFIENTKAVVNIRNKDNRCFGYAMLYILERPKNTCKLNKQPNSYTNEMFESNNLLELPYPIHYSDVSKYEDLLQCNRNVFSFFDDDGKARYPMFISRKIYPRWVNLGMNITPLYKTVTGVSPILIIVNVAKTFVLGV